MGLAAGAAAATVVGPLGLAAGAAVGAYTGSLWGSLKQIEGRYRDLYARVKAKSMWRSVYDQASFVLARCVVPGATAERRAAEELLKLLKSFA